MPVRFAMQAFWQDMQHGLRLLKRAPGFAAAAIVMLGLGVGAATAMFGIVDSVLLRPLPFPDSHRIVTLSEIADDGRLLRASLPTFQDWTARARSFDAIAAMRGDSTSGQLIANQLYGVSARDASVFIGSGLLLAATALLAAYLPARRASRTNPIEALRAE
jgi:ABC-type antimicrobial peptide transport system permease subunit